MHLKRICLAGIFLAVGLFGAPAKSIVPRHPRLPLNSLGTLISADLDGNGIVDMAAAGASRHEGRGFVQDITVRLGSTGASTIAVHTDGIPLRLRLFDLDGDSDRDLVVEAFDRKPLAVLLNDGAGHFREADLDEFRERIRQQESHSLESPAASSLSSEISEDAPHPVAEQEGSCLEPSLTGARIVVESRAVTPVLPHWSRSNRGPPLHF